MIRLHEKLNTAIDSLSSLSRLPRYHVCSSGPVLSGRLSCLGNVKKGKSLFGSLTNHAEARRHLHTCHRRFQCRLDVGRLLAACSRPPHKTGSCVKNDTSTWPDRKPCRRVKTLVAAECQVFDVNRADPCPRGRLMSWSTPPSRAAALDIVTRPAEWPFG